MYRLVIMANITMKRMRSVENGLRMRTKNLDTFGENLWISQPINTGMTNATATSTTLI